MSLLDALRLEAVAINALAPAPGETIAEQAARHEADNAIIARVIAHVAALTTTVAADDDLWLDAELRMVQAHWNWPVA